MARRRGNHEGSIQRLPSGSYRAQVTLQGQRLSYTAPTRKQCQDWLKQTIKQIDDGLTYANTKITVAEYLAQWLISMKPARRPASWTSYEIIATRKYLVPYLGNTKLKDLRSDQIQRMYGYWLEQGISTHTVLKVQGTFHSALAQAEKLGMINRNPVSVVQLPKAPDKEMAILTDSQVSHLLVTLQGHRLEALFHLAVVTGMRQMELLGLKWTDLDWIRRTLKVERQLERGYGSEAKFSGPKTRYGKRTIVLGKKTIEVMRSNYERQQGERQRVGDSWNRDDLIFTNRDGGPLDPRNLLRDFKILLKNAGLPVIRFHDLRHTAASLMLNNGIAPIIVSRRLGHAKASITLDVYGHLIPSMGAEAAEMMDALVMPVAVQLKRSDVIS